MKKRLFSLAAVTLLSTLTLPILSAQEPVLAPPVQDSIPQLIQEEPEPIKLPKKERNKMKKLPIHVGLSGGVNTLSGIGGEVAVELFDFLALRGGYATANLKNISGSLALSKFGVSREDTKLDFDPTALIAFNGKASAYHALLDLYPFGGYSTFHITVGAFFGAPSASIRMQLVNPDNGKDIFTDNPQLNPDGYEITLEDDKGGELTLSPNRDASFDLSAVFGSKMKPYFGIGWGRAVPQGIMGMRFELGLANSGEILMSSTNLKQGNINDYFKVSNSYGQYYNYTKWYPVVNLSLTIRIL